MRVMLTSCGLETTQLEQAFLTMLGKAPKQARVLFVPTAAIDAGAVMVLGKCMNDMLKVGARENQITVFDLHRAMALAELSPYDVVYLCGGRTQYLLDRMNDTGFSHVLMQYIAADGMVIGVSAGSLIFTDNLVGNLGLLDTTLSVHNPYGAAPGKLTFPFAPEIYLSNTGAILVRDIPGDCELVDEATKSKTKKKEA